MATTDTVLAVINVLATITSVLLYLSPLSDFRGIVRRKATGEVALLPIVVLFGNSVMWTSYGALSAAIFPVCVVNAFGALTTTAFSLVFYAFAARPRHRVVRLFAAALLLLCVPALYILLAKTGAIRQSSDTVVTVMGYGSVAVNIAMYASPLATMRKVVLTRSVASLPIALSSVSLANGSLWVAYGILARDMFVLVPNAIGVVLTVVQVGLYLKYRHATPVEILPVLPVVVDDSVVQLKSTALQSAVASPVVVDGAVAIDALTPTTRYEALPDSKA